MHCPSWLNRTLIGFGLASLLSDASYEMVALALPGFVVSLIGAQSAPFFLGLISGFSEVVASIARLISGIRADRSGHNISAIITGYSLTGFFIGFIGFATQLWHVFLSHLIAWAGKGMREAPRDALITASVEPPQYGHAFGLHRAMDTFGAVVGPLVMFFVANRVSLRTIFFMSWIPGLAAVIVLLIFLRRHRDDLDMPHAHPYRRQSFDFPLQFWLFLGVTTIFAGGFFSRMLIILRVQQLLGGPSMVRGIAFSALLYVLFNIVRATAEYTIGVLGDRINKTTLLAIFGYGLFGILSWLLSYNYTSVLIIGTIFVLFGICVATVKVMTRVYAATLLPAHVRGTGFALVQLIEGFGVLGSSALVGYLWSIYTVATGFMYAAIISIVAAAFLLLMPQRL